MADESKAGGKDQVAAEAEAARKAQAAATRQAVEDGADATEAARKQDAETLKAQEAAPAPYPSQEEADAIKSAAAAGAAAYATRQLKP